MRKLALALLLVASTAAAKPSPDLAAAKRAQVVAKANLAKARAAAKLAGHRVKLAKARAAADKAAKRLAKERWIEDCITERTGPDAGVTPDEAVVICEAEAPDAEVK